MDSEVGHNLACYRSRCKNAPALGCNGYITFLEQNRHLLSKRTETGVPSPVVTLFGVPLHQSTFLGELYIFGFFTKK